jgi:hypothetical protein
VYARDINGETFTFGVSGKLSRNVLLMYDRQTDSLWSQLIGEAIQGDMVGTKLEFVPSWMTTWAEWKALHPDTIALEKGFSGGRDPYEGYYQSSQAGVLGETLADDRLATKAFVVGVELDNASIAYPFTALSSETTVNDVVDGTPLLVVFDPDNSTNAVFDRTVNGQTLTFVETNGELRDEETGTVWDRLTGVGLVGENAGIQLTQVKSVAVFWFGWKDFHPDTLVYGIE